MPTSMDHSKYRYENFEGRPNVWIGYHLNDPATRARVQPLVLEVARKMFVRAPRNTYVLTGPANSQVEVATMYRLTVERDDEVLGFVAASQGRKGSSVLVDNQRIRNERERGGALNTSDTKRAAALALKKFIPTSNEEVLVKSYANMNEHVRSLTIGAANQKRNAMDGVSTRLLAYVEKNWDTRGKEIMDEINVPPSEQEGMTRAIENHRVYATLRDRADEGLTFVIQKSDTLYAVPFGINSNHGTPNRNQRAFHYDDAPDDMRMKVGALKAAQEGQYVPDFGLRLGKDSFMIFFDLASVQEDNDADD